VTGAHWPSWPPCPVYFNQLCYGGCHRHSEDQGSTTVTVFLSHFPAEFGRAEPGLVAAPAPSSAAGAALAQCLLLCWGRVF